jgi:hypothetical protein
MLDEFVMSAFTPDNRPCDGLSLSAIFRRLEAVPDSCEQPIAKQAA